MSTDIPPLSGAERLGVRTLHVPSSVDPYRCSHCERPWPCGWARYERTCSAIESECDEVRAEHARALAALKSVEWCVGIGGYQRGWCPLCGVNEKRSHDDDCLIGQALRYSVGTEATATLDTERQDAAEHTDRICAAYSQALLVLDDVQWKGPDNTCPCCGAKPMPPFHTDSCRLLQLLAWPEAADWVRRLRAMEAVATAAQGLLDIAIRYEQQPIEVPPDVAVALMRLRAALAAMEGASA